MKTALLLIAHGSRQPEANADLWHVVEQLRVRGRYAVVEGAFLELSPPTIEEGGRICVDQGAQRVLLLPYFLSAGVHVREDLTVSREQLSAEFPSVQFMLAEPMGKHPLLVEIVEQRAREVDLS